MITSGLVLTLASDPVLAMQAVATLRARPEITIGNRVKRWLPIVTETPSVKDGRDLHDWLGAVPGVEFVDVAQVNFDEDALPMTTAQKNTP